MSFSFYKVLLYPVKVCNRGRQIVLHPGPLMRPQQKISITEGISDTKGTFDLTVTS